MRSAERFLCTAMLALGLAACASAPQSIAPLAADIRVPVLATANATADLAPAVRSAFDEARRALRAGRMAQAERGFKALTQSHPELGGPHANLGLIYLQSESFPQAVAELELATAASPGQPLYFNHLGIAYRHAGQFAKARQAYERALALDPSYTLAILNLGVLSDLYLGDSSRALMLYEQYLRLSPGDLAVAKWIADLKNRKPPAATPKEKE